MSWATLVFGLGTSSLLAWAVQTEIRQDSAEFYANASERMTLTISDQLNTLGLVLRSAAGLITSSDEVSREDWRRYVQQLEPRLNLPGVQGFGYVPLIRPDELAAHEARVRAEGFPDYRVTPDDPREIYSAIMYLEPFDERNQRAFGYDMYSEPLRRSAMDTARDSGQPAISDKVELLQETGTDVQAGTLMYFPVYGTALSSGDTAERREQLRGWTYSPLRMGDLMQGILQEWQQELTTNLRLYIYDANDAVPEALLYRSRPDASYVPSETHGQPSHHHRRIDFNGQSWLLVYDFDPSSAGLSMLPAWYTLAGGVIITLLLVGLQLSLQNTRRRAEQLAGTLTSDIRERDRQLRESEFRWKYALEGAGDGLWDWNLASNEVYFTPRWKEMLGFAPHEIGNSLDEWKNRVHPDDLPRVMDEIRDYLEGRSYSYASEHRVLCKGGSYKWILDRGVVVDRDRSGKPLRMIGTHADIEARKQDELRLRETLQTLQRMQYALDQMDTYVYLKDTESRYLYANRHTLELFGTTLEQVRGRGDSDFFPEDVARRLREIDLRVLAGENTQEEIVAGSGSSQRVFLDTKSPMHADDQSGRIIGLCGVSTDITARKQLETVLQQRQEELEQAQRVALMGSWTMDLVTGKVTWSEQLFRMFGLPPGGTAPSFPEQEKIFSADSWTRLTQAVQKTRDTGVPYDLELETITPDGIRGWMLARGELVRDADWNPVGLHGIAQDITQRKRAEQRIAQLSSLYAALSAINRLVITGKSADDIFQQACDIIIRHGGLQMAWIGLVEKGGMKVVPANSAGIGTDYLDGIDITIDPNDPHGQGATGTAIRENRPVWVDNFRYNTMATPWQQRAARYGWVSSAALPISRGGKPIGAMTFYSTRRGSYDQEIRQLLEEMGRAISFALDRIDAETLAYAGEAELEKVFLQTVGLATNLVELRDPYTAGHVRKVSALSEAIGTELGFDHGRLQGLRVAGFLYDIGKILIPAEILSKPGRLTAVEHQLIRQHPRAGLELLQKVEFPWPVAQVALQHHERLDGSGYPQGLKGDSIVLEARIIGLADVVLAMCSHRPYRAALPLENALAEIEGGRGTRYDAAVVDACLRLFREGRFTL